MKIDMTGLNETLSTFAQFANASENRDRALAMLGPDGSGRNISIVEKHGDFVGNVGRGAASRETNEIVRDIFLNAVVAQYGTKMSDVPQKVLDALRDVDFGKGKPLTARRIRAVLLAHQEVQADLTTQFATEERTLGPIFPSFAPSRPVAQPQARPWSAYFAGGENNVSSRRPVPVRPEDPQACRELMRNRLCEFGGILEDSDSAETGVQASRYYNPADGREYEFDEYTQGGGGGNHCFFLSSLRLMGLTPSVHNAQCLREMMRGIVEEAIALAGRPGSPLTFKATADGRSELFFGDLSLEHLQTTLAEGVYDRNATLQADVACGILLAHVLQRPVVMVETNARGVASFQTFDRDILTGAKFANREPVHMHYMPGHFQALKLVGDRPLLEKRPAELMKEKLFPADLGDEAVQRLTKEILKGMDGRMPAACRASERYLADRIDEIANDDLKLAMFRSAVDQVWDADDSQTIQDALLGFFS